MAETEQPLLRTLSFGLVTFYGLGNILGAGIYVLVGKVVGEGGNLAPLSFLLASVIAALTAFTYAEMASRYPVSAGGPVYVFEGFGVSGLSILVGILTIMTGIVSAATIARGFVGYLNVFLSVPGWLAIILLISLLGMLAAWGILESVRTAAVFTLLEVFGLLMVLWITLPYFAELPGQIERFRPTLDPGIWPGILSGAFLAFYAFVGFEDMVNVAEEVRNPEHNLPRSILLCLGLATVLYMGIAFAVLLVLPPDLLSESDAPLADVYVAVTGRSPVLITLIAMVAVVNGALIQIIMSSRVCYGMSRQNWLPAFLSRVSPSTRTPVLATALATLAVIVMALWLPLENLARATSAFLLLIFSLINLSLMRVKSRTGPIPETVFKVPHWVPVAGFLASTGLLIAEILNWLSG